MAIQIVGVDSGDVADVSQQFNQQANQTLTNSLQSNSNLVNNTSALIQQGNQSIGNSVQAAAERGRAEAEQAAYRGGQFAGLLSGSVAATLDLRNREVSKQQQLAQQKEASQRDLTKRLVASKNESIKQRSDVEFTELNIELRNLQNDWQSNDKFRKQSPLQFRDAGYDIINKSQFLTQEQKRKLVDLHLDNTDKSLTEQNSLQQEYGKRQAQEYRDFQAASKQSIVNNILGGLSAYTDPSAQLTLLNNEIQNVLDDKDGGLTLADRLYVATSMLKTAATKIDTRNTAYSQIQDKLDRFNQYAKEAVPLLQNPTPENQALNQALEEKYGVKYTNNYFDPVENQKRAQQLLESQRKITELRNANLIDSSRSQILSNNSIGVLALQVYQNPGLRDFYKQNPEYGQRAGVAVALDIAEKLPQLEQQKLQLSQKKASLYVDKERLKKEGILYLINDRVRGKQLLDSYKLGSGVVIPDSEVGLTAQEKSAFAGLINDIGKAINVEITNVDSSISAIGRQLEPLGLNKPVQQLLKELPAREKAFREEMNGYNELTQQYNTSQNKKALGVINPTSGRGAGVNPDLTFKSPDSGNLIMVPPSVSNLKTVVVPVGNSRSGGKPRLKVILPVPATANASFGNRDYDETRGNRKHAGEDIAVPVGTPVVSYVGGTVVQVTRQTNAAGKPDGYGRFVTIRGDDGLYHRFAHLSSFNTSVGQRVEAGDIVAGSGNDGRSSGAHIHWEVRSDDGYGSDGTLDPLEYMSGQSFNPSVMPKPRGNTNGWNYNSATPPLNRIPNGATPLPDGLYLLNGKVGKLTTSEVKQSTEVFTSANPVKSGYDAGNVAGDNDDHNTYGYAYLANNEKFRVKLNQMSKKLGINAQWLVDIMAFETGNFTKANDWAHSKTGATGLIGFTPDNAKEFGVTMQQLTSMPTEQQLDYVYKYLSLPELKPHIGKGVEYLAAAVFGGYPLLNKLIKNRGSAMKIGDSYITLDGYLKKLGRDVGRRYGVKTSSTRFDSLMAAIHEAPTSGCVMCQQLISSDSFVPHESNYG
jgi:murein DD-endopeptidase MepM/ murein hydrolase activator NlpD